MNKSIDYARHNKEHLHSRLNIQHYTLTIFGAAKVDKDLIAWYSEIHLTTYSVLLHTHIHTYRQNEVNYEQKNV